MEKDIFNLDDKSNFEEVGDVQLFFYMKTLLKLMESDGLDSFDIEDTMFINLCNDAGGMLGIDISYPLDHNYICALSNLNKNYDFSTKQPSAPISRPVRGVYRFEYSEDIVEYVTNVFRHTMVSYSKDLIVPTIDIMQQDGDFAYYDGIQTSHDVYDSYTNRSGLDSDSIKKLQ